MHICCVEDESEFDYLKGSKKGPSHWGELKKEWTTCKNGKMQSPIDMPSNIVKVVPKLGVLKKNYKPQNAIIRNRGHDIQVIDQIRNSFILSCTIISRGVILHSDRKIEPNRIEL